MDAQYTIKRPSCSGSCDGKITLNINNTSGQVFINWINMPKNSILYSGAKTLDQISAGEYIVEIEDDIFFGKTKKVLRINIPNQEILKFDFVKVNQPVCEKDYGSIDVFWSGGVAPFKIYCDTLVYNVADKNNYSINHLIPSLINLSIEDSLGCKISYEPITIQAKTINLDLDYTPIKTFGGTAENVQLNITGAAEPIKIIWYNKNNLHEPIYTNINTLSNKLYSGEYLVKIIDNNNCTKDLSFNLPQPKPIVVKYNTSGDYSNEGYFGYSPVKQIYNSIIFPITNQDILNVKLSDRIVLINNKTQDQSAHMIISQPNIIKINNIEYYLIKITPGVPFGISTNTHYSILINNNSYDAYTGLDKRNKTNNTRIIITSFILDGNLIYKFRSQDTLQVLIDNDQYQTFSPDINIPRNVYSAQAFDTILDIDLNNYDLLYKLNRSIITNNINIRSLLEKNITKKGIVYLNISGGVSFPSGVNINGYKYKIVLFDSNKKIINTFFTNDYLSITNLDTGQYYIDIRDIGNNPINIANKEPIYDGNLKIYIPGSIEEEQVLMNNIYIEKFKQKASRTPFGIKKFVPLNNLSNSILLSFIEPKEIHINGPNNFSKKLYTKYELLSNLVPGTYTITDGTNSKIISLFSNNYKIINSL